MVIRALRFAIRHRVAHPIVQFVELEEPIPIVVMARISSEHLDERLGEL